EPRRPATGVRWSILAIGWLVGLISACGCDRPAEAPSDGRLTVVATTTMIGDLVQRIGQQHIRLTVLMPPGVDPHSFKPSTADMGAIARAQLIFYNGLHLEGKMIELLEQKLADRAFAVTRDISIDRLLPWEQNQGGAYDPHVWFDPTLWAQAAQTIAMELIRADPANASTYESALKTVQAELATLDAEIARKIATIPRDRRVLITSHDAFNYFGAAYEIEVRGLQGISTETQAGLTNIAAAVDYIVQHRIPAIFVESSVPHDTILRVQADCKARGVDVKIGGELYSDALGAPGERPGYAVETYAGMMRYNVDLIVNALR
ncbi:MAG: zinc ABC transporter substrate-binding protein, partial [Phycisphaerae bacterium]|nr:zinc ABC transporter substrate-binding protein [Phycisphaerae bacterium]